MPKVSVVIPAYNAMRFLPATIESVLAQSFADFEVLVVDDGSTDNTAAWVAGVEDPRVKLISQANGGAATARNKGIAHAKGEYIAFLDADDIWEPSKLEKQVALLDARPEVGLVDTWISYIDEQGQPIGTVMTSDIEGEVWEKIVEYNIVRCGSTPMVCRRCFEEVGTFDQSLRLSEDWEMWIRIAARYQFAVIKEPLVRYRQHPNNKHKDYQAMLPALRQIIEKTFRDAPEEHQHLKNRAFGRVHLHVAWRALLYAKDYREAARLRGEAITYYPRLRYAKNSVRLWLNIVRLRWLGR